MAKISNSSNAAAKAKTTKKALSPAAAAPEAAMAIDAVANPLAVQTEEQVWLKTAQQDWDKKRDDEKLAEQDTADGKQIIVADASDAAGTKGSGESLIDKSTGAEAAKGDAATHKAGALLPADAGINYGVLAAVVGGVGVAALAASGGGGDAAPAPAAPAVAPASNIVTTTVVAGPVILGNGLSVTLYQADGTTVIGSGALSANGTVSINVGSYTGVIIAKIFNADTGADYMDEATGTAMNLTANLMTVGVGATGTTNLSMNVLTTVAATLAGAVFTGASTGVTAALVTSSNAAVASAFGLNDLMAAVITTVDASGANNANYTPASLSAAELYGAILAALSGVDLANNGNMQTGIDDLVFDLEPRVTGSTATLSTAALDVVIAGANLAAGTANGTDATGLVAVLSDLTIKVSPDVSIDTVSGDNIVIDGEMYEITGTKLAGAVVTLSIGGIENLGVTADLEGTTWTYYPDNTDRNNMGLGGETIIATATLGSVVATATRSIVVALDPNIVHASTGCGDVTRLDQRDSVIQDITVSATVISSMLTIAPLNADANRLQNSDIAVESSQQYAQALLYLQHASGNISNLTVTADTNAYAYAFAGIRGADGASLIVGDHITISATDDDATAHLYLHNASIADVANGTLVSALGDRSSSMLNAEAVSGTISALDIQANGYLSSAQVIFANTSAEGITLEDVSISTIGGSAASLTFDGMVTVGATLNISTSAAATAPANASLVQSSADSNLFFSDTIITVEAGGFSGAQAKIDAAYQSTGALASGDIAALTITASGYHSNASVILQSAGELNFHNIDVNATGDDATALLDVYVVYEAYEITLAAVDASSLVPGNYSLTIGDNTVSYEVVEGGVSANDVLSELQSAYRDLNLDFDNAGANNMYITADSTATISFNDVANNEARVPTLTTPADFGSVEVVRIYDGALPTDNVMHGSDINVTASNNNANAEVIMDNVSGTLGNLVVHASGFTAGAMLDLYQPAATGLTFVGSDVSVTADSSAADAGLYINNVSGSIDQLIVQATGYNAFANANIGVGSGTALAVSSIELSADGYYATAEINLYGMVGVGATLNITTGVSDDGAAAKLIFSQESNLTFNNTVITVQASGGYGRAVIGASDSCGDIAVFSASGNIASIVVAATGSAASAELSLNQNQSAATGLIFAGGNVSVIASAYSADASLTINNVSGNIGDLLVTATGGDAFSYANIGVGNGTTLSMSAIRMSANGDGDVDAAATLNLNGMVEVGNTLDIAASSQFANASLVQVSSDSNLFFNDTIITVEALGGSAYAKIDAAYQSTGALASGTIEALTITASGVDSDANVILQSAGGLDFNNIEVTADNIGASALLDVYVEYEAYEITLNATDSLVPGTYTLTIGNIEVSYTAQQDDSGNDVLLALRNAYINLGLDFDNGGGNNVYITGDNTARISFNDFANNEPRTPTLTGPDGFGSVTVDRIDDIALSRANVMHGSNINVTASSDNANAEVIMDNVSGTLGNIEVQASGADARAALDLYQPAATGLVFSNSNVSVTATTIVSSGLDNAIANLSIDNVSGSIDQLVVQAADRISFASANISVANDTALSVSGIDVSANGYYATAELTLNGMISVSETLNITAQATGAEASLSFSQDLNLSFNNTEISVLANGSDSSAVIGSSSIVDSMSVASASGHINLLAVQAASIGAEANAVLAASGSLSLDVIEMYANSGSAGLSLTGIDGSIASLLMSADGIDANATATISLSSGYIVRSDIDIMPINSTNTVALTVDQTVHGGNVYVYADASEVTGQSQFNLAYNAETADQIYLGYTPLTDGNFSYGDGLGGTFNLILDATDKDFTDFTLGGELQNNMLSIYGFDSSLAFDALDSNADDTINFGVEGEFVKDLSSVLNLDALLAAADTALDVGINYYFGVVDTDGAGTDDAGTGYLAFDADGDGISKVIEFVGLIDFDYSRIMGAFDPTLEV